MIDNPLNSYTRPPGWWEWNSSFFLVVVISSGLSPLLKKPWWQAIRRVSCEKSRVKASSQDVVRRCQLSVNCCSVACFQAEVKSHRNHKLAFQFKLSTMLLPGNKTKEMLCI